MKCPKCNKPMEARSVKVTRGGKEIEDTAYVCTNTKKCTGGAFIPTSIFGVGP